jgi:hypothetical protein
MSVLRGVLDRLDREDELDAEVQAAERAFLSLLGETPAEVRDRQGWTPELVTAGRRYARALTERGEYFVRKGKRLEENLRGVNAKYEEE